MFLFLLGFESNGIEEGSSSEKTVPVAELTECLVTVGAKGVLADDLIPIVTEAEFDMSGKDAVEAGKFENGFWKDDAATSNNQRNKF